MTSNGAIKGDPKRSMEYLIDHLQSALSASPITHPLTITVVESRCKSTTGLFPYVENPPKVGVQQVLVTISADIERDESLLSDTQETDRLLLCALEAYVYHVPSTSSCLVYISKVDSTGYSPDTLPETSSTDRTKRKRLPPTTYFLLKAFLSFYHPLPPSKSPRIRRLHHHKHAYVQLFARSANQYLFPNSILGGSKKVLGGIKLCKWWRRVFEEIALDLNQPSPEENEVHKTNLESYLTYYLPAYEHLEARSLLGISPTAAATATTMPQWLYLPPGDPSLNSLLFAPSPVKTVDDNADDHKPRPLAMLVPTFEDDPKARFLVELVINNPVGKLRTGRPKRAAPEQDDQQSEGTKRQRIDGKEQIDDAREVPQSVSGDQASSTDPSSSSAIKEIQEKRRTDERRLRQEDAAALASISWDNFWTRMGYRQECISGDVTGFFSMYVGLPPVFDKATAANENGQEGQSTEETAHQVSHPLFGRIAAALLNHDFANRTLAIEATRRFLDQTENIVVAEIGRDEWTTRCTARVEKNDAGRAFQDSSAQSLAQTSGANQAVPAVNVLQVKKKKKPAK
ncbi:hypothetical protein NliqN6_2858 [Naganishia liquefaciens]|uniref:histone acetyltransferase n=1 Tax=Naganishia liquefaciens TaxID=104408 RepID=A0A8H3YG80_9TREE|nr:hypothetical protein NliqN6_2858 [Naganishia liquefaciens]